MTNMETQYRKVEIKSEQDLPKEDGVYFTAKKNSLKANGLKPMIYTVISKKKWLRDIEFYFQPLPDKSKTAEDPIIIKLKKDDMDESYYDSSNMYDFCKKHKIKIEEPRDSKTGLFKTFIITLSTPEQKILFNGKYIGKLQELAKKFQSHPVSMPTDKDINVYAELYPNYLDGKDDAVVSFNRGMKQGIKNGAKAMRDGKIKSKQTAEEKVNDACNNWMPDKGTSATRCVKCGKDRWEHEL